MYKKVHGQIKLDTKHEGQKSLSSQMLKSSKEQENVWILVCLIFCRDSREKQEGDEFPCV